MSTILIPINAIQNLTTNSKFDWFSNSLKHPFWSISSYFRLKSTYLNWIPVMILLIEMLKFVQNLVDWAQNGQITSKNDLLHLFLNKSRRFQTFLNTIDFLINFEQLDLIGTSFNQFCHNDLDSHIEFESKILIKWWFKSNLSQNFTPSWFSRLIFHSIPCI